MQDSVTRCLGLVTQYNPLATQPGALIQADDCVIRRENTVENRRGYAVYGSLASQGAQLMTYLKKVIAHSGTNLLYDNGSGSFSAYAFPSYTGTYNAPASGYRMRSVEAKGNLYFTSDKGVQVITDTAGTAARRAGAPRSLDPSYTLTTSASGFLGTSSQCAYRVVIQRTDANSNVLFGYPSTRLWVTNTDATNKKNVALTLYLPSEVTISDVIQFYRTAQYSNPSPNSDLAADEMALVYQVSPSSTDIANGYITFTDSIVDALRGASLYTSPSQEGITQANDRPPLCKDMTVFKSAYMFYANTSTKQRLNITLVGTSGLTGNTITIAGTSYSFAASENAATGQVAVGATLIAAADIDTTARSLVRVINRYSSNTSVYAYYTSGPTDLPGQIMIEERGIGAAAFSASSSNSTISGMFFPPPPTSGTNAQSTSSNSVQKNGLYYAKFQQNEHVPVLNYVLVGPANTEILRVLALRDSLIIIKEEGIYALRGDSPQNFSVIPLDLTVYCKAKDSVCVIQNQVLLLSNQGVVAVSDTGVQVVSREIEPNLLPLLSYSNLAANTYGTAYESERTYFLSTISTSSDSAPTQIFTFNLFTRTWTRWTFAWTAGIVEPNADKLYFLKPSDTNLYSERKSFTLSDYADPEYGITITAISGLSVTFTVAGVTPLTGWVIQQGTTGLAIQSVVNTGSTYTAILTVNAPSTWTTGTATLFPGVNMQIQWDAWTASQPGLMKHVRQFEILTDNISGNNQTSSISALFKTDLDGIQDVQPINTAAYRWGTSPWGGFPWGGRSDTFAYCTLVPRNKQYCRVMNAGVKHNRAQEKCSISGCSYTFDVINERVSR